MRNCGSYNTAMRFVSAVLLFILAPSLAFAAGFAKQSMFLSQSTVTEGETVFIYATIENDTPSYFTGTLKFSDDSGPIGQTAVSLSSGVANTVSVSWTPKAGQHDVTAKLEKQDGTVVESEDSIFFVNSKPSPAAASGAATSTASSTDSLASTTVESSQPLQNWIHEKAPGAASLTGSMFSTLDKARAAGARELNRGTDWSTNTLAGASKAQGGWQNTLWLIFATLALYVCSALSYVLTNIGVFYPVLAVVFLFILWRLFRMARR